MELLGIQGIANGYRVDAVLWRGAQPADAAWTLLYAAGCRSVIDLNSTGEAVGHQRELVTAAGLVYSSQEWNGVLPPSQARVDAALASLVSLPAPVFVHCQHGSDRTGTLCACWRMAHDGWSLDQAIEEAFTSLGLQGMHEFWMAAAVAQFAERRKSHAVSGSR